MLLPICEFIFSRLLATSFVIPQLTLPTEGEIIQTDLLYQVNVCVSEEEGKYT